MLLALLQTALTVFAAASLHGAFAQAGRQFEALHPGCSVRFDFNGSQILEAQLENGAGADVFASADRRWMDRAVGAGVAVGPVWFAGNQLVIVASRHSKVMQAADLAQPGTKVVVCADAAPCGRYTRVLLSSMDRNPAFGPAYAAAVTRNVVSEELDVESVLGKVMLGEADAGIVYASDARNSPVRAVALPRLPSSSISYYAAVVRAARQPALARQFLRFLASAAGRRILSSFGFFTQP